MLKKLEIFDPIRWNCKGAIFHITVDWILSQIIAFFFLMKLCSTVEAYIAGDTPARQLEAGQQCGGKWIYWKYQLADEKDKSLLEILKRDRGFIIWISNSAKFMLPLNKYVYMLDSFMGRVKLSVNLVLVYF